MFIVRFEPKGGGLVDEYYYHKIEDALYHLHLFDKDDSELYERIVIFADSEIIISNI